jgi:hypothetical protein
MVSQAAPDAVVLLAGKRVGGTQLADRAAGADRLGGRLPLSPLTKVKPAAACSGASWVSTNVGPVHAPPYGLPSSVLASW